MNSIIGVIIVLFVLGILFFVLGSCFCHFFGREESIEFAWLLGFVLFLGIFALLELPIELSGMAFHVLVYVELAVFAVLFVAGGVYCIHVYRSGNARWQKPDRLTVVLFSIDPVTDIVRHEQWNTASMVMTLPIIMDMPLTHYTRIRFTGTMPEPACMLGVRAMCTTAIRC